MQEIKSWRGDIGRQTITQEAWEAVADTMLLNGFDKESYEYSIARAKQPSKKITFTVNSPDTYLVQIERGKAGNVSLDMMRQIDAKPKLRVGTDEDGNPVQFCHIDGDSRGRLTEICSSHGMPCPTFLRISIAAKELANDSKYPTLGIDSTLPQHRLDSTNAPPYPLQNDFPVWYFFYGTLTDRAILSSAMGRQDAEDVVLNSARVFGARLTSWGGKYKALVEADAGEKVDGRAYLVRSKQEEESLRIYETGKYQVSRCQIEMETTEGWSAYHGLTFSLPKEA